MSGTKERILDTAMALFSRNGYCGTSMSDIAGVLGLTKAALYRHYESKEEIWNSLYDQIEQYYSENFCSKENMPEIPDSADGLVALTMHMAEFTIRDEKIVMVRKILSIEQFRDGRACAFATKHFLTGLEGIFTDLFKGMIDKGLLRQDDPEMLAFAYTTPISALIHLCDREPDREKEVLEKIRAFSEHFIETYGVKE